MKSLSYIATLDAHGFPVGAPITQGSTPPGGVPWEFGINQKIQTRSIKTSKVNVTSFVKLSNSALGLGTIPSGGSAFLSTSLTPQTPHAQDPNFAIAFVGVFIGTSQTTYNSNNQLYPTVGGSQAVGQWDIRGDYDYNGSGGTLSGTTSTWNGVLVNNSGATGTIQFVTRWKYIDFNSGTVT